MDNETRKRSHNDDGGDEEVEEPIMDDLVVASVYALAQPRVANQDDNEIDVDQCLEEAETTPKESELTIDAIEADKDKEPESDNESDVDLTEELAQMIDEDGDGDEVGAHQNSNTTIPPRTAHEIDLYQAQAKQLESDLALKLTVDEQEAARIKNAAAALQPAGTVHQYLEAEGTIIVQSAKTGVLLQEGTLLVLKSPDLLPLGKILEVFGPVSQPLYSIRWLESNPQERAFETTSSTTTNDVNGDENQNSTALPSQREILAKALAEHPTVYYVPDGSCLLDVGIIFKNSGKGCDASNVFDEEVVNPAELDYSDDEEERMATGRARSKKRGNQRTNNYRDLQQSTQYIQPPNPNMAPSQYMAHAPHGFHPVVYNTMEFAANQVNYAVPTPSFPAPSMNQAEPDGAEEEGDTVYYDF